MKRLFSILLVTLSLNFVTQPVFAQSPNSASKPSMGGTGISAEENAKIAPIDPIMPPKESGQLFFGQRHFYSVTLRGNGEAIVYARLVISNQDETPLTTTSFQSPVSSLNELSIFQQKLSPICVRYDYNNPANPNKCLETQEPDYSEPYYYNPTQPAQYKKN